MAFKSIKESRYQKVWEPLLYSLLCGTQKIWWQSTASNRRGWGFKFRQIYQISHELYIKQITFKYELKNKFSNTHFLYNNVFIFNSPGRPESLLVLYFQSFCCFLFYTEICHKMLVYRGFIYLLSLIICNLCLQN